MINDKVGAHKNAKKSKFHIFPYFWYAMFECFPSTKKKKKKKNKKKNKQTFVLQFVLGSHTIWLN